MQANQDTPEVIFKEAQELMARASRIGSVVLISMNTAKQQRASNSRNFAIVAPYDGKGQTLMMPEPSTTGQKYDG